MAVYLFAATYLKCKSLDQVHIINQCSLERCGHSTLAIIYVELFNIHIEDIKRCTRACLRELLAIQADSHSNTTSETSRAYA
mmetsp:Transcript_60030/g.137605  ORF Transcript_60030/g.137605 Transcript_60030/m.137605 type:complete len:82 (+) Transcript_60030:240-485(+)